MGSLTAVAVKTAGPGRPADGQGLYLHVRSSGSKAWLLRVQSDGRRRGIDLGSATTMTLTDDRDQARALRKMTREGVDPVAKRQHAKVIIPTFAKAAEECHEQMQGGWRNAEHAAQWLETLRTYALPSFGSMPVDQVDSMIICDALAPV